MTATATTAGHPTEHDITFLSVPLHADVYDMAEQGVPGSYRMLITRRVHGSSSDPTRSRWLEVHRDLEAPDGLAISWPNTYGQLDAYSLVSWLNPPVVLRAGTTQAAKVEGDRYQDAVTSSGMTDWRDNVMHGLRAQLARLLPDA
jgi:hypothetical protein